MVSNKIEIKETLAGLFRDKADFALLFGSLAGDESHFGDESDVDCGVFFCPEVLQKRSYFDIAEQFQSISGRKLDIICLNTADIIVASQVVMTGEEVFTKSKGRFEAYRAQILSRYLDFKKSRKIIEDNILVRPNYGR